MAKETTQPKQPQSAAVDMGRLTQRQAAWLVNKPAVWFRDNPHRCGMNSDGKTYDGRELIDSLRSDFKAATLSDSELHHNCNQFGWIFYHVDNRTLPLKKLQGIKERHGAAGMASVGDLIIYFLTQTIDIFGDGIREWSAKAETDSEIREQAMRDAEKIIKSSIERRDTQAARLRGDVVSVCGRCDRYRWGKDWYPLPLSDQLAAFAVDDDECPTCAKERPH